MEDPRPIKNESGEKNKHNDSAHQTVYAHLLVTVKVRADATTAMVNV